MSFKTDVELKAEALIIKIETNALSNTANRVGVMLENIIDSKISLDATNFVFNETPTGIIDDINKVFILANLPTLGTLRLYVNGVRLKLTTYYTISGNTVTFIKAPSFGAELICDYLK